MMKQHFGNPSSVHAYGREAKAAIENARRAIAKSIGVSPSELFFTSGGTEANNMAIQCSVRDLGIRHAITSRIEHHAVLHTLEELEKKGKIKLSFVNLDEIGRVNLNHLEELLEKGERSLVSLMHANNEVGNLLPIKKVGEICGKYDAIFHSDTVQTMGHYTFDMQDLNVHFITCAAHKFHGPKGVGFLYINSQVKIHPFIFGGAQERNMRGGTENTYGIIGLAKALEIAYRDMAEHVAYIQSLKSRMIEKLKETIPGVLFNGDSADLEKSLYTVLNVSLPESEENEMLLFNLDLKGISVSGGSACASGANTGSHVLGALYPNSKRGAVRFSFSKYNKKEEIDFVIEKLAEVVGIRMAGIK